MGRKNRIKKPQIASKKDPVPDSCPEISSDLHCEFPEKVCTVEGKTDESSQSLKKNSIINEQKDLNFVKPEDLNETPTHTHEDTCAALNSNGKMKSTTINSEDEGEKILSLESKLQALELERDEYEDKYQNLLEKIAQLRDTVGAKLKADAADLTRTKNELESMTEKCRSLEDTAGQLRDQVEKTELKLQNMSSKSSEQLESLSKKLETAENMNTELDKKRRAAEQEVDQLKKAEYKFSAENSKLKQECNNLKAENQALKMKYETAVLAATEREKELEARLASETNSQIGYAELYRKTAQEAEDKLAKYEAQCDKKFAEYEEMYQNLERHLQAANKTKENLEKALKEKEMALDSVEQKLQSQAKYDKTIKEKDLLIGKLRHEAVILNEHLRSAMHALQNQDSTNLVDRELISNLLIQFITIPRADTKKYEILQLISSFLDWDEERKVKAGLSRAI